MNEDNQEKKSRKKVITLIAAIVLILIAALVVFWFNSQIRATTMRILRMEGVVSLEDNGKERPQQRTFVSKAVTLCQRM